MKKLLIITFFIACNTIIYSQTKSETKDWILETYNSFKRIENKNDFTRIENDSLIFHSYFYKYTYSKVAFKYITSIQIKKKRLDGIELFQLNLKTNNKIEGGKYENGIYTGDYSNGTNLTILLDANFELNDYPKRMEKALLHIINLNGGKAKVTKEAF